MDKPILTSYGLNYWWTIGANEVQFCRQRTNTYLTDLHRALAHSLKTRMGRDSIFLPEIRRDKFEQEVTGMTDFNQKTHDTDVGSQGR